MTTKTLPTDKNGNVYYGPTTYEQAEEQINAGRNAAKMAEILDDAGYTGLASRIRREYGVAK